mmetsp:Transcript_6876/g.14277  ORF Transcript_6876/g.14277 Transcript_6876/m.14277 type:complete len:391 (+) Transcript_6876:255-1427(+)
MRAVWPSTLPTSTSAPAESRLETMPAWPRTDAAMRAVVESLSTEWGEAPAERRARTMGWWPSEAAAMRGVMPSEFDASTATDPGSAFSLASSISTTSVMPLWLACSRVVTPSASTWSTLAPFSMRSFTKSVFSTMMASINRLCLLPSSSSYSSLGSAPLETRRLATSAKLPLTAALRAVLSSSSVAAMSAPASSRILQTSRCPAAAAIIREFTPSTCSSVSSPAAMVSASLSRYSGVAATVLCTSAPAFSRLLTHSSAPTPAANMSAVPPLFAALLTCSSRPDMDDMRTSTTSHWAWLAADMRGVTPSLSTTFLSAPLDSRNVTTSAFLAAVLAEHSVRAVPPFVCFASTLAPALTRALTHGRCPDAAAYMRAVTPSECSASRAAPADMR